jgi:hypothetical protein
MASAPRAPGTSCLLAIISKVAPASRSSNSSLPSSCGAAGRPHLGTAQAQQGANVAARTSGAQPGPCRSQPGPCRSGDSRTLTIEHWPTGSSRRPHLGAISQAAPIRGVHHPNQAIGLLKVVAPVRAQRLLAAHVPHVELVAASRHGPDRQAVDLAALNGSWAATAAAAAALRKHTYRWARRRLSGTANAPRELQGLDVKAQRGRNGAGVLPANALHYRRLAGIV